MFRPNIASYGISGEVSTQGGCKIAHEGRGFCACTRFPQRHGAAIPFNITCELMSGPIFKSTGWPL